MSLMFRKPSLSPRSPHVADGISLVVISDDISFRETAGLQEDRNCSPPFGTQCDGLTRAWGLDLA